METLESLDMVVVVFATNHLDVKTTYHYGVRGESHASIVDKVYDSLVCEYGEDALQGFEVLSIVD